MPEYGWFYNGPAITVVRVFAAFHYPPLIKFKCSKKHANQQAPALSVDGMLAVVILSTYPNFCQF